MKTLLESINDSIDESLNRDGKKLFKMAEKDLTKLAVKVDKEKLEIAIEKLDDVVDAKEVLQFWTIEDSIAKGLVNDWGKGITIDGEHILAVKCSGMSEVFSYNAEDEVWEEF